MSDPVEVRIFPRALRDLEQLQERHARLILEDLEILRIRPWPPAKVKKLHGTELWEIKTGDYRTLFLPQGRRAVVVRVLNRRDLERTVGRIDPAYVFDWLRRHVR